MIGYIGLAAIAVLAFALWRAPNKETPTPKAQIAQPGAARNRPLSPKDGAELDRAANDFLALYREGLVGTCTDEIPELTDTRLGGPKVWPRGLPLPADPKGRPLVQLAHINLSDLPPITSLPKKGTLQVLVAGDDLLGCDFPSTNGNGYVIVLHDADCTFEQVHEEDDGREIYTPIYKSDISQQGRKIAWEKREVPPTTWDYRLKDPFGLHQSWPENVAAVYEDFIDEQADVRGHYDVMLLGHPDFTQEDIRRDAKYRGLENLIGFSSSGGAFMWGDVGEACILLPPEALRDFDLSKALYFYDCC